MWTSNLIPSQAGGFNGCKVDCYIGGGSQRMTVATPEQYVYNPVNGTTDN
jgi:hypothetical protein